MGWFRSEPPMDQRPWDYMDASGTADERDASSARRDYRFSLAFDRASRGDDRPVTYMDCPDPPADDAPWWKR